MKPVVDLPVSLETAQHWLSSMLTAQRFQHSLGSLEKALELCDRFRVDDAAREKIAYAALLHDCAKLMTPDELFDFAERHGVALSLDDRASTQTVHAFVGAELVRDQLQLEDEDILNAIRYHTTGRAGMTLVEKVVFIADKIEENTRNPLFIQKVNAQLDDQDKHGLDRTALFLLDATLQFLMDKHQVIHPRTLAARNDLVTRLKRGQTTPHS